ncbi:7028_t:CDS:2, partial [Ambispora leptoticha]
MTKTTLTNIRRHEICLKKQDNPNITQKDLVEWCKQMLRVEVDQVTISRLLKRSNLEEALLEWCLRAQERILLTDKLLRDLQLLCYQHPMKVNDFLNPENENVIDEQFTDKEIVKLFCKEREVEIEDEDREGNYSKEVDNIMKVGHVLERLK